jgi:uncharacterized OB-fold protein
MSAPGYVREIPQRYRLEAARCATCAKLAFPPRRLCPSCRGATFEKVTLAEHGTLVTWTVIHVPPREFAAQAPYVVGIVELGESTPHGSTGARIRVTAQIADVQPEDLAFGMRLIRVLRRIQAEGDGGILHYGYKFVPTDSASVGLPG